MTVDIGEVAAAAAAGQWSRAAVSVIAEVLTVVRCPAALFRDV
jgi:hypothetical protein